MPQIEVKFDIDANGIFNVSAKDLGTGKEQTVRIEQSSGLTQDEIERRRKDAEEHAAEDQRKRNLAELRNKAESMVFQLEKMMKEHKDKIKDSDRGPLEAAIKKVRDVEQGRMPTRSSRPSTSWSRPRTPSARRSTKPAAGPPARRRARRPDRRRRRPQARPARKRRSTRSLKSRSE